MATTLSPSESYSITMRLEIQNKVGMLGKVTTAIGEAGGDIGAVDLSGHGKGTVIRDVTARARGIEHAQEIINTMRHLPGVKVVNVSDRTFLMHLGGKIEVHNKIPVKTRNDLSMAYTPGVARVCMAISKDVKKSFSLTIRRNAVAIVSDGTAVLGLGDIGPEAAMPVMEGKAMLFKEFGGIDAWPICLNTKDPEEIIRIVKSLEPTFGGINLEDISAPRCFEIEGRLKAEMGIPVFHDDQHGTAVVVLAALLNSLKIVKKRIEDMKIVVAGVGAAGVACSKIIMNAGARNIIGVDRVGAIYKGRKQNMNFMKEWYAENANPFNEKGKLTNVLAGADMFIGLAAPGLITVDDLKKMAKDPIVFAMANPDPEIMPEEAAPFVRIMATGRSDYPNQINNVLCFPGIFRGALDSRATCINEEMKLAAAYAIASCVGKEEISEDYIIPSVFNRKVAPIVAKEVSRAAHRTKVARRTSRTYMEIHLD
ncbi:MAG: NAD-dependent malic enzyme [Deltaproteobacteria bacterium CG2_30_66_27]|nr:MAG: NAD-dependent malic enzyme [Deltaproteobacteria bacterium CG2_30_66_27]PJB31870.1 MAG: NAD-dependent malic enzyme [Deltaproteobacteria bacterium CG_4_9_14_3_um_filter_65_9]